MLKQLWNKLNQTNQQENIEDVHSDELIRLKQSSVFRELIRNNEAITKIYKSPKNQDINTRGFIIGGLGKKASIVFLAPIVDTLHIEKSIVAPLLTNTDSNKEIESIIINQSTRKIFTFKEVLSEINRGNTILFIDNYTTAFAMDTVQIKARNIEKAENEVILKGPKEGFTENVFDNISLIRKKFKTESLINESVTVSKKNNSEVFILYLDDVVNPDLLEKVKKRLQSFEVDVIQNLGILEQYIEDKEGSLFPTTLYTEKPDRAASFIQDGYIVLLMDSSPASLVVPATFWAFFHTPDEHYLRFLFGNFTRALRGMAIFIALFTSAIYISITNYHAQMIPPDLLLAISSTRERVPFPAFIEILIMEIAFELIREAGLRVPNPIGPTIGIVGALILGQAAVEANVISPLVIIVVALSGLSSFAVSDISFNFAIRIIRFIFIIAAGVLGIYGMVIVFVMGLSYMVSIRSFGVPYLAPMTPRYKASQDTVFRRFLQNERWRPGFLKPKDLEKKGDTT
ncbi:spore germination protein KA [Bacillus sp. SORGH_AS 510]|uniref:spore germination protein n=1 Tax=Bacillus sp. SORGH_AS_0510 TaxID=3041771 RepID=UPI00277D4BFD|nr:spore germination protein [Bacillus sp. SORGH_AS_0510]MDQ1146622.1 spore germination protein KA [Bacillus sp. SORGH_AS_0510]